MFLQATICVVVLWIAGREFVVAVVEWNLTFEFSARSLLFWNESIELKVNDDFDFCLKFLLICFHFLLCLLRALN